MRAQRRVIAAYTATAAAWGTAIWAALGKSWVDIRIFALTAVAALCATIGCIVHGILRDLYRRSERNAKAVAGLAEGLQMTLRAASVPAPAQVQAELPTGPMLRVVEEED